MTDLSRRSVLLGGAAVAAAPLLPAIPSAPHPLVAVWEIPISLANTTILDEWAIVFGHLRHPAESDTDLRKRILNTIAEIYMEPTAGIYEAT